VAVWPRGSTRPRLALDAGTGLREVTPLLEGEPFRGSILLTHLHWDHVQGLPFFVGGDRDDAVVDLWLPDEGIAAAEVLGRAMSPPHFPIGPDGLRGTWRFGTLDEGWHDVEGLRVLAREVPHKGGRTFGYRLEDDGGSVAYLPDHRPAGDRAGRAAALELAAGVDVLIHDAQFVTSEAATAEAFGHATIAQALALADECGARELVLFHHAPSRTDDQLGHVLATAVGLAPFPIRLAQEGDEIEVGGAALRTDRSAAGVGTAGLDR
jgi:ribonuclease BN (tRNA processing enzyme)